MDEKLKKRRLDINKRLKFSYLFMIFGMLAFWGIIYVGVDNIFLVMEIILMMVQVDEYKIEFLLTSGRLLISVLPTIIYFVGIHKIDEIMKESKKLYLEEIKYVRNKQFEEQKPLVQEFLETVAKLPRGQQIELLNFVKEQLKELEKNNKIEINSYDEYSLCYIQKELEDILFPSIVENNKGYSKTRKK